MARDPEAAVATMSADEAGRARQRAIRTAVLLSVGSEITTGETRDTNASELARALATAGVRVLRISGVPDDLDIVREAFATALQGADLVVSTGGLGPTPDDLTREAIAALTGEQPAVDPELERWLRDLWTRRDMPFPEINLKQAWLIPSASAIPNPNGTAPGWWVDRSDGRLIVALPGPPREMRAMWAEQVLPRLRQRGLGGPVATRTLRLTGIGESQVADLLGEELLRAANPQVATYARAEAVDVRISAVNDGTDGDGNALLAEDLVAVAERRVLDVLGNHVWANGETTWAEALEVELERLGWTLSVVEIGTGGAMARLLGDRTWLRLDEALAPDAPAASAHDVEGEDARGLDAYATRGREVGGSDVGLAVRARPRGADTAASVAVVWPGGSHRERRLVFLGDEQGRARAVIAGAAVLLARLRAIPSPHSEPEVSR
jgi:nicotinamide-nucleotide amidase